MPRGTVGPLSSSAVTAMQRMVGNAATTRALTADRGRTPRGTDPTVQRAENDNAGGGTTAGAAEAKSIERVSS